MLRDRESTFAIIAAILVLFTSMLDARVSAILAVVLLVAFAVITYLDRRGNQAQ
ncbi:MAG: hypothetical protein IT320_25575 [Anaerolineae bacterium]|nr:hypothetical protein [Anaerolineae bacterium]